MNSARCGPLKKMKVIEISNVIAGPFCASLFADYGADVIKVELPDLGDPVRGFGPKVDGQSLRWPSMGRNKRCITLNLNSDKGKEIFLSLIKDTDIVIESFKPGVIEKWGIDYNIMKSVNQRLILVRISGYGQTGPYKNKPGFGTSGTAFSGYTALHGFKGLPPVSPAVSLADFMAGIFGFIGGLSAYVSILTECSKEGQIVDTSLYEPLVRLMDGIIANYSLTGEKQEIDYMIKGVTSPCGTFSTKDKKWIIIVCSTQKTWENLPIAMGMTELLNSPMFKTNQDRLNNDKVLTSIINDWVATLDLMEVWNILDEAGVPASPVFEVDDMFNNEQYISRRSIVSVSHPVLGEISMPSIIPRFSDSICEIRHAGPSLGEHNEEIYKGQLSISDDEYKQLIYDNII